MERIALIIVLAMASTGVACQTPQSRLSTAVSVQAVAKNPPKPELPASCTELVERVKPRLGEAWVVYDRRWNIVADNRDQAAEDCQAQWDAYWTAYLQLVGADIR